MFGSESVVIESPGVRVDPYSGEQVADDWSAPTRRTVYTLCPPEPRPSQEPVQDARHAVVSGWTLYLPADTVIGPRDRVQVRGATFPVQGEPAVWGDAGVVVQAFRTEG